MCSPHVIWCFARMRLRRYLLLRYFGCHLAEPSVSECLNCVSLRVTLQHSTVPWNRFGTASAAFRQDSRPFSGDLRRGTERTPCRNSSSRCPVILPCLENRFETAFRRLFGRVLWKAKKRAFQTRPSRFR